MASSYPSYDPRAYHGPKNDPIFKAAFPAKKVKVKQHTRNAARPKKNAAPAIAPVPVDPNQAIIDAATNARYGPQELAIKQQLAQNARFTGGLPTWYANAMDEIRGLQAGQQKLAADTAARVGSYNSAATLVNPTDQQAANARNNLNAEFTQKLAADATANSGGLDRFIAAMGIQKANELYGANVDRENLIGQRGALGSEKAAYATQYGGEIAKQDAATATKQQANDIAAKALGIKTQTLKKVQIPLAKSLASDRTAKQKVARSTTRERVRHDQQMEALGLTRNNIAKWKAEHPSAGKKNAGSNSTYSKSKVQGFRANWEYALEKAHQLHEAGSWRDKQGTVHNIDVTAAYQGLLDAIKDPDIAKAAAYTAFGKPLSPQLIHNLAVKGVHPPAYQAPKIAGGGPYGTGRMP